MYSSRAGNGQQAVLVEGNKSSGTNSAVVSYYLSYLSWRRIAQLVLLQSHGLVGAESVPFAENICSWGVPSKIKDRKKSKGFAGMAT